MNHAPLHTNEGDLDGSFKANMTDDNGISKGQDLLLHTILTHRSSNRRESCAATDSVIKSFHGTVCLCMQRKTISPGTADERCFMHIRMRFPSLINEK